MYVREAHAIDSSWPMGGGRHPIVEDPVTQEERNGVAAVCMTRLALDPIPALVDDMDDTVNEAYQAWPDRLFLVGTSGDVAYQGGRGPFGFKPAELEEAIRAELGLATAP